MFMKRFNLIAFVPKYILYFIEHALLHYEEGSKV